MDFLGLKIARLLSQKFSCFFEGLRLLSSYCCLVFKIFSLLLQHFGNVCYKTLDSSSTKSFFFFNVECGRVSYGTIFIMDEKGKQIESKMV